MKLKKHSRIAIVIGTKAELIKCVSIMIELQKNNLDYWFIHTGQHPLGKACEEFGVKKPDFILSEEPKISTKFWSKINRFSAFWCFGMIFKIRKLLRRLNPNYIIYHGDTMSTAVAAIASSHFMNFNANWKNVHLEAGLRSGSWFEPFPEEISRKISDFFSHILFAVSNLTEKNLLDIYGKSKKQIIKVGNTIIDVAHIGYNIAKTTNNPIKNKNFVLINLHRHENLTSKARMLKIVEILKAVRIKGIWPLHDNTEYYLHKYDLMKEVQAIKNIEVMPLKNYFDFIYLLANCKYLITDGGSIQEESLVFKKPCILLRNKTERQEGLSTGINFLTNLNVEYAKSKIKEIENNKIPIKNFNNPYGKKGLSRRIVKLLR